MAAALDLWLFACAREREEEEAVRREAEREEAARQGDEVLRRVAEERDRELGRQGEEWRRGAAALAASLAAVDAVFLALVLRWAVCGLADICVLVCTYM